MKPFKFALRQCFLLLIFFVCIANTMQAENVTLAFYNVENLFDTINNAGVNDADFTPQGKYKWNSEKYKQKIDNISKVISEITPHPDIIAFAEVENENPLIDLVRNRALSSFDFDYADFKSRDLRGIGVALLFSNITVVPIKIEALKYHEINTFSSRDILYFMCRIRGEVFHILVCHLPSVISETKYRNAAAKSVKFYADSIACTNSSAKIVVVGDFNANPHSGVMRMVTTNLNNPFEPLYDRGYGSYMYNKRWNMYDAILVSKNIENPKPQIFIRDYLISQDGSFKGFPFRSFSSQEYLGGFSDHLPVVISFPLSSR